MKKNFLFISMFFFLIFFAFGLEAMFYAKNYDKNGRFNNREDDYWEKINQMEIQFCMFLNLLQKKEKYPSYDVGQNVWLRALWKRVPGFKVKFRENVTNFLDAFEHSVALNFFKKEFPKHRIEKPGDAKLSWIILFYHIFKKRNSTSYYGIKGSSILCNVFDKYKFFAGTLIKKFAIGNEMFFPHLSNQHLLPFRCGPEKDKNKRNLFLGNLKLALFQEILEKNKYSPFVDSKARIGLCREKLHKLDLKNFRKMCKLDRQFFKSVIEFSKKDYPLYGGVLNGFKKLDQQHKDSLYKCCLLILKKMKKEKSKKVGFSDIELWLKEKKGGKINYLKIFFEKIFFSSSVICPDTAEFWLIHSIFPAKFQHYGKTMYELTKHTGNNDSSIRLLDLKIKCE